MHNADLGARTRIENARVKSTAGLKWQALSCAMGAAVAVALSGLASTAPARADGGLETQKGGLFHRKGWLNPEIYRRRDAPSNATSENAAPSPARTAAASRATAATPARPRSRQSVQAPAANAARPRIPRNVVSRREQAIQRSARAPTPPRAASATRVASLTTTAPSSAAPANPSVTGGGWRIYWLASSRCLAPRLRAAIAHVALNYGRVRVTSTCRSRSRNRRVGGARNSYHLTGQAADFRVFGNLRGAARYLRSLAGGYKHYGGGLFHIDTGPKRSW